MPRVPYSCRHYRRESLKKYPWSPFGKHSHRALIRQVCRESSGKRLQDMMYAALPPPPIWLDYPSWNVTIVGLDPPKSLDKG